MDYTLSWALLNWHRVGHINFMLFVSRHLIEYYVDFDLMFNIGCVYAVNSLCYIFLGKNVEKYGRITVFPGGYGPIGEIMQGQLQPDWGL